MPIAQIDTAFQNSQYGEAGLWLIIAGIFGFLAIRHTMEDAKRRRARWAAVVFVIFASTDVIEAQTGAWYRPWWLLALKTICLAALVKLLWDEFRRGGRRREPETDDADSSPDPSEPAEQRGKAE